MIFNIAVASYNPACGRDEVPDVSFLVFQILSP